MSRRLANKRRKSLPRVTELGQKEYSNRKEKILEYQKVLEDEDYISYAIDKIAAELTHFLTR